MYKLRKHTSITILALLIMIVSSVLTGCGSKQPAENPQTVSEKPGEQTITDHAGRQVTIPNEIDKVYYTTPIGYIFVYVLAPEKMTGTSMKLSDDAKKYILPECRNLPYLGGQQMNAKINTEELLKANPDLIFNISPEAIDNKTISESDKLQEQLNIPVVIVDASIENTEEALTFMGQLLGTEDRAKELAAYCQETLNEVINVTQAIPADQRARVYYAEGPEGLATEPSGSRHAQLLDILNIVNVADCQQTGGKGGMSSVSLEQVLEWNPDVILTWSMQKNGAYDIIMSNPDWENISAVKNGKVYEIPSLPFNWFDRPPSISRFLGMKWLTATLYSEQYPVNMVKETQEFYKLFYHIEVNSEEANTLLQKSLH